VTRPDRILIGARGSPLSLAQTGLTRDALAAAHPQVAFEIVPIVTTGDRIQDRRLNEAGGKGLFTKELDEALLDGRIDLAVHSMKDLPTTLPEGVRLASVPPREDPRDALIAGASVRTLEDLAADAKIGTASLRRQAQLLAFRPGYRISMLRGNVDTRLKKLAAGDVDATLLALSGLRRLGLESAISALIDPHSMPPAAGQGALAITSRTENEAVADLAHTIEDPSARLEITAERAFLEALDGSCRTPIAALGRWCDGKLWFVGEALSPDGVHRWRRTAEEPCENEAQAAAIGRRFGASVKTEAGSNLYQDAGLV